MFTVKGNPQKSTSTSKVVAHFVFKMMMNSYLKNLAKLVNQPINLGGCSL